MSYRPFLMIIVCLALSGCWNGGNTHVNLGDVSLGTQLLDLKSAFDSGAITQDEFEKTKETLLALNALCETTKSEESWWF